MHAIFTTVIQWNISELLTFSVIYNFLLHDNCYKLIPLFKNLPADQCSLTGKMTRTLILKCPCSAHIFLDFIIWKAFPSWLLCLLLLPKYSSEHFAGLNVFLKTRKPTYALKNLSLGKLSKPSLSQVYQKPKNMTQMLTS